MEDDILLPIDDNIFSPTKFDENVSLYLLINTSIIDLAFLWQLLDQRI